MGWKGAVRSINAELNRQAREAQKRERQYAKEAEREQAAEIVEDQQHYFSGLVSLHHQCNANLDWDQIRNELSPKEPKKTTPKTDKVLEKLNSFSPNFIEKLFNSADRRKKRLEKALEKAKETDLQDYQKAIKIYRERKEKWQKKQDLALKIASDPKAAIEAINDHLDIQDTPIGKNLNFEVSDEMEVDVNLKVNAFDEVIPEEEYSLRQSGTLSTRKMAKGKGLELYQDHVCSAVLRVARETLGILPVQSVRMNALLNGVNSKTGHLEDQIIISVIVVRQTLNGLNLRNVDPSDSLSNFVYNMDFKKTKGFSVVENVELDT